MGLARFFQRGAQFFVGILVARLLGPEGRGLVSALMVPTQIAINFAELGIRQSAAFHIGKKNHAADDIVPSLMSLVPLAGLIAIGASLAYYEYADVAEGNWLLRFLAVISVPLSLLSSYATGVFLGTRHIAEFRKASWRPTVVVLIFVAILVWGLSAGVMGVMVAYLLGSMTGAGYALFLLAKRHPIRMGWNMKIVKDLQRVGIRFAISLFILTLNYRIMVLLLAKQSSLEEVGYYTLALTIAELIWEVPAIVGSLVLSRSVNAKQSREFSKKVLVLTRFSFLGAFFASIGIGVTAQWLIPMIYGSDFYESVNVLIYMLPGIVAFTIFKTLNTDLAAQGHPMASLWITVPLLLSNVVLGYWAAGEYGARGAAMVSSISYVLGAIGYLGIYSRFTGIPLIEIISFTRSDLNFVLEKFGLNGKGRAHDKEM